MPIAQSMSGDASFLLNMLNDDMDFDMEWACCGILDEKPNAAPPPEKQASEKRKAASGESDPNKKMRVSKTGWRKYGQKTLKGKEYTGMKMLRCYYRCNHPGCQVKKQVETSAWGDDPGNITITGIHNHPTNPQQEPEDEAALRKQHAPHLNEPKPTPPLDDNFADLIMRASPHFVVTDPHQDDCPIIFASSGFLKLTGYKMEEILGRNCRFLQGKDTNPNAVRQLTRAIQARKEIHIILLNYKKDGTPFWNLLHISPIIGADGTLHCLVGSQLDVSMLVQSKNPSATVDDQEKAVNQAAAKLNLAATPQVVSNSNSVAGSSPAGRKASESGQE